MGERFREDESVASIEGKRLVVLDSDAFVATHNTKEKFEEAFINMLHGAHRAGNIILVIENIAKFFNSIESFGSDAASLMDQYLSSSDLQFIGTSDPVSISSVP